MRVGEGRGARAYQADVSEPTAVDAMFRFVAQEYRRLDILVNNAGIVQDTLLLSMTIQDWTAVHSTNLTGAFLCTRHAVEMMLRQGGGTIVNIASASADVGGRGRARDGEVFRGTLRLLGWEGVVASRCPPVRRPSSPPTTSNASAWSRT
jgi:NAD(P)-dependent dehydrogenase (short-subunit alcohol dehydrogenase family)